MPAKKDDSSQSRNRGLKTEINPLLLSSNPNLIRRQYKGQNPYLSTYGVEDRKIRKRFEKGLKFHEKGEVSAAIEHERESLKILKEQELQRKESETQHQEETKRKVKNAELPDTTIGEEKFAPSRTPVVEWWDKPFLGHQLQILPKYTADTIAAENEGSEDEDDEHPSIRYVEHPTPIKVETSGPVTKVYLTKNEQKRIRRNKRKLQREEHEARIKMGLDLPLEPKVSLRNMMNVYENNQNISDPTAWESTVKQQVASRKRKHQETNATRHEQAQQNKKSKNKTATTGNHCRVFRFQSLSNPRIRYKLKTNAQQLSLNGLCLRVGDNGGGIIVIAGSEKSCRFYDKLVTRRIRWDENFEDRETNETIDMKGNHAEKLWEGEWEDPSWGPFFMKICRDEQELREQLRQRNAEHLITSINGK